MDDQVPELEPGIYEECPACGAEGGGCLTCFDQLLVPHECEAA
jgi:hypothetical protein